MTLFGRCVEARRGGFGGLLGLRVVRVRVVVLIRGVSCDGGEGG